jgi:23S rRNA (guanine745-N1)-methyltransferase
VRALDGVLGLLACPQCGAGLEADGRTVRCAGGHAFDVARQGYLNLLVGARHPAGDSAEMVAARDAFLGAGHYAPLEDAVAAAVAESAPPAGCVAELGAGTARYLAAVLDRLPDRLGVALDTSAPALRRAARAHPRAAAIGADAWGALPLRDGAAAAVLCVFAPRGGAEIARVLTVDGALVVAAPEPDHLAELAGPLGLLAVDPRKRERLAAELDPVLAPAGDARVEFAMELDRASVSALAGMGPSARHADPGATAAAIAALDEPVRVTAAVTVSVHRKAA